MPAIVSCARDRWVVHPVGEDIRAAANGDARPVVLIVEDEAAIAELFLTLFKMEGFRAVIASHNSEAVELLKTAKPDVILLDIMMPLESGLDLCRFVRNTPHFAEIPIVIVSARAQDRDVDAGYKAGANAYLKKPVPNSVLINTVRTHLRKDSARPAVERRFEDLETAVRSAAVEVKRYLAEIARAHGSYNTYARRLQDSQGLTVEEKQELVRKAADSYRDIIRENESAGWEILYAILRRVEAREAAIRARGAHEPTGRQEWQIASARATFVAEDCMKWAAAFADQICEEYGRALEDDDRVYAYLLERYGQQSLEEEGKFEALSNFRSMIIGANGADQELDEITRFYDLLNPLRAKLSGVRLPDAVLLVHGSPDGAPPLNLDLDSAAEEASVSTPAASQDPS